MVNKKGIIGIVVLIALSVGSIVTVNAMAQPKEEITISKDVLDPEYSSKFTEEELRMNDLVNQSIYQSIGKEFKVYESYGLSYNVENNQLYFNDVPVKLFVDNLATDDTFEGTIHQCELGNIGVIAKRDEKGNLVSLDELDENELAVYLKNR